MNTSSQEELAKNLYFNTNQTQQQIAGAVGVTDRTIRTWIKKHSWQRLKRAAISAPAIIVENMFSQVVELQNHIASREEGKRFPTLQEAETTRKLITCIQKLNFYPSLGAQMQVMKSFMEFTAVSGNDLSMELAMHAKRFFENSSAYQYKPYEIEFGLDMYPFIHRLEEEGDLPFKQEANLKAEAETEESKNSQSVDNKYFEAEERNDDPPEEAEKSGMSRSFRSGNPELTLTKREQRYRGRNGARVVIRNNKKYLQDKYGRIRSVWKAPWERVKKQTAQPIDNTGPQRSKMETTSFRQKRISRY